MPVAVALYVLPVAPPIAPPLSDHWFPVALDEVSKTFPPAQNVVAPPALIVGVAGDGFTVTAVARDAALAQPPAVAMTV